MQCRGKVVVVGVCDVEGSTNLFMAKAFELLGYEVVPCNYRTIIQKYGNRTLTKVLQRLSEDKPSLMIFSKCNGIESSTIARCSLNCKTWLWWMDPLVTLMQTPEIIEHANMADYVSATGLGVAQHISKHIGGAPVHHIMEGVDPEIYRPTISSVSFNTNVSFIGTANPERVQYIELLRNAGLDVRAYGQGFEGEAHGIAFNLVCSSSLAMLALNTEHTTREYFSDRIFRLGACGAFVFHSIAPGMEKYFTDGEDLVYFDSPESLLEAMRFYFQPEQDGLRRAIAENLRRKVLNNYTWAHSVQRIIDIAEI